MPEVRSGNQPATRNQPGRPLQFWGWIGVALAIVVVDQITKLYFDQALQYGERWHVLPFFDFTLLYNPGAAFSFLAGGQGWQRWLFTAIALGATGLIIHLLRRNPQQGLFCASLTCILGGAIGNVIDRIQHGHVIDFLLFYWDSWYFPAFNVADVAITCGAILLILDEIRRMRHEKRKKDSAD
ncbi:signal peptidase II [Pollutimonas harenae]|uniref:Lipoprotein signal peptidase n=1 Tax=Pollutimonas harenae TaxID=657015 RepID=A0A853GU32_9BURK|nr:signal peptidase II [Pollutimonas harenae]NYT86678.1 lipoprotein signal peptidase [Pollutimonas harenae]TEA71332.1 lipoprotein signal peptidase [Pollutimonas harenae]